MSKDPKRPLTCRLFHDLEALDRASERVREKLKKRMTEANKKSILARLDWAQAELAECYRAARAMPLEEKE